MNRFITICFFFFLYSCSTDVTQKTTGVSLSSNEIKGLDAIKFAIRVDTDSIQFIKVGADTTKAKPTIIFLQGSLPKPLVFDLGSFKHINLPFDYSELLNSYNLIVISMPNTPVEVSKSNLNSQYCYVADTAKPQEFSHSYLQNNYLQNYVKRTNMVIDVLKKQHWVSDSNLILIGHSQGAKIATVVAAESEAVTDVALLGFNAFGRYDELIRRVRKNFQQGRISGEEYENKLKELYENWRLINSNPKNASEGYLSWTSFSIDYMPYLLKIETPVFIGYGTEDLTAENCDLIPIHFIQEGKRNLTLKPYLGLDHNFFEVKNGSVDRKKGTQFTKVINDIINWSKN